MTRISRSVTLQLMAHGNIFTYPLDVPAIKGPGVRYREADAPGNASHLYVPPENPIRQAKGDIGFGDFGISPPAALTGGAGAPWKNLRQR